MNPILLFFLFFVPCSCQQCYWPDGSEAQNFTVCAEGRGQCCYNIGPYNRDLCYDNGFCYSSFYGEIYRGACADKRWDPKSLCAPKCKHIDRDESVRLTACDTKGKFCCGGLEYSADCCKDHEKGFSWQNATFLDLLSSTIQTVEAEPEGGDAIPNTTPTCNAGENNSAQRITKVGFGAGIGAGVGISIALLCGVWLVRRLVSHQRNLGSDDGIPGEIQGTALDPASTKVYPYTTEPYHVERPPPIASQVQAVAPAEMDDAHRRHELPTG